MLRTITELVPFGDDKHAKRISTMYLANMGRVEGNRCDYFVGYYERASIFTNYKDIRKFKYISNYDRMASTFDLMLEIYCDECWIDGEYIADYHEDSPTSKVMRIFDERANTDIGFVLSQNNKV